MRLLVILLLATAVLAQPVREWTVDARVSSPIDEMSGLAASRKYPGVIWTHNDSGDKARIFAINRQGKILGEHRIEGAGNSDWEDIACDDGKLYISDLGNNSNKRKDLAIYVVDEPAPEGNDPITRFTRWPVAFPEQDKKPEYDCEALFVADGTVYVLTKERALWLKQKVPGRAARLYRLDTRYTDRVNQLTLVERRTGLGGWVTAADLSPDGKTLAVLCHRPVPSLWLFERPADSDRFLSGKAKRLLLNRAGQIEAVTWLDEDTLQVGNEAGHLCRITRAELVDSGKSPTGR